MYNIYTYDIAIIKQVCLLNYLTTFASISAQPIIYLCVLPTLLVHVPE